MPGEGHAEPAPRADPRSPLGGLAHLPRPLQHPRVFFVAGAGAMRELLPDPRTPLPSWGRRQVPLQVKATGDTVHMAPIWGTGAVSPLQHPKRVLSSHIPGCIVSPKFIGWSPDSQNPRM